MTTERINGNEGVGTAGAIPEGERRRVTLLRFIGGLASMLGGALLLQAAVGRLVRGIATLFAAAAAIAWGLSLLGGGSWVLVRQRRRLRRMRREQEDGSSDEESGDG